jgi:hypothetical protein
MLSFIVFIYSYGYSYCHFRLHTDMDDTFKLAPVLQRWYCCFSNEGQESDE